MVNLDAIAHVIQEGAAADGDIAAGGVCPNIEPIKINPIAVANAENIIQIEIAISI